MALKENMYEWTKIELAAMESSCWGVGQQQAVFTASSVFQIY